MGNWGSDTQRKVLPPVSSRVQKKKKLNWITTWWLLAITPACLPQESMYVHISLSATQNVGCELGRSAWTMGPTQRTSSNCFFVTENTWTLQASAGEMYASATIPLATHRSASYCPHRGRVFCHILPGSCWPQQGRWPELYLCPPESQREGVAPSKHSKAAVFLLLVRETAQLLKYSHKIYST